MKFTEEQLDSFIALYKREFGEELTREQARIEATDLVVMVETVYKPISRKTYEKYLPLKK